MTNAFKVYALKEIQSELKNAIFDLAPMGSGFAKQRDLSDYGLTPAESAQVSANNFRFLRRGILLYCMYDFVWPNGFPGKLCSEISSAMGDRNIHLDRIQNSLRPRTTLNPQPVAIGNRIDALTYYHAGKNAEALYPPLVEDWKYGEEGETRYICCRSPKTPKALARTLKSELEFVMDVNGLAKPILPRKNHTGPFKRKANQMARLFVNEKGSDALPVSHSWIQQRLYRDRLILKTKEDEYNTSVRSYRAAVNDILMSQTYLKL
ncbi:hypothetical protein [Ruegeria sp. R14_0]|uniref:hypothetical protein n=1 Tax=Ruegeria sp. R14_0 TaxID=2821100 RepID=UPI001ADA9FD1|nr:hypothetical protein [Ruegeria sp. R14_0]MBO9445726.1 hypothetical protein [Ruegeria sp. R14_0]